MGSRGVGGHFILCVGPSLPPHPTQPECQSMCQRGEGRGGHAPKLRNCPPPTPPEPERWQRCLRNLLFAILCRGEGGRAPFNVISLMVVAGVFGGRIPSVSDKKVFCPFPSLFFLRQFFCLCASSTVFFSFAPPAAAAAAFCMFNVAQRKKRKKGSQSITHTRARQAEKAGGGKGEDARSSHPHGGLIF